VSPGLCKSLGRLVECQDLPSKQQGSRNDVNTCFLGKTKGGLQLPYKSFNKGLTCQKSTSHAPSFSSVKEYRFLSMMEIFDFQHPENVNIFMMIKNCSLFRQYPTPLPALAGSS